ncbi:MAG: M23 family metallopeptidase [Pseudobdellovibrionaceae bacterium]
MKSLFLVFIIVVGLFAYRHFILGGVLTENLYPPNNASPYLLPWKKGESHFCFQGNNGVLSHKNRTQYAWDFLMLDGTDIYAARAGRVAIVVDGHEGRGSDKPNNEIYIDHGDGTSARYAHIRKHGSKVKIGDEVQQGQVIGSSGDVGRSLGPHLHFEVINESKETIPISFSDVEEHSGVPRTFFFYSSKNGTP